MGGKFGRAAEKSGRWAWLVFFLFHARLLVNLCFVFFTPLFFYTVYFGPLGLTAKYFRTNEKMERNANITEIYVIIQSDFDSFFVLYLFSP